MSQGIGARDVSGGWVGQLHARLAAEGHRIRLINLSVTGARVRDVVDRQLPQLPALGRPAASRKVRIADLRGMTVRSLIGTRAEDHFHPNERGYARITGAFDEAIDRAALLA
jgi:lysophospholipase L1-like esterase